MMMIEDRVTRFTIFYKVSSNLPSLLTLKLSSTHPDRARQALANAVFQTSSSTCIITDRVEQTAGKNDNSTLIPLSAAGTGRDES